MDLLTTERRRTAAFIICALAAIYAAQGEFRSTLAALAVLGAWWVGYTDPSAGR